MIESKTSKNITKFVMIITNFVILSLISILFTVGSVMGKYFHLAVVQQKKKIYVLDFSFLIT